VQWSPQQDAALRAVKAWLRSPSSPQVFRLFGYAGTGKTTIAREAQNMARTVNYASFTGKAALVMRRKGCDGARTIHSLIYLPEDDGTGNVSYTLNWESEIVQSNLVVVDEVSMVDRELGSDLLRFGVKVLVLGDPAQLPPIEGTGYFTQAEPDVMLTEIHRQAADNPIIAMATRVRNGNRLQVADYGSSRVIPREELTNDLLSNAEQVIVGTHVTRRAINTRLRKLRFGSLFADVPPVPVNGDRLVCLRNNRRKGLLNGSLWDVRSVGKPKPRDRNVTRMVVATADDDRKAMLEIGVPNEFFGGDDAAIKDIPWKKRKALDEFDFGYALTCHKSQGSQWDDVLILDQSGVFREDWDRWLYTALTRAAESVTVVQRG
jgi:exodeoxyribonuclease-5